MDRAAVIRKIESLSERIAPLHEFTAVAAEALSLISALKPKRVLAKNDESYFFLKVDDRWSRPTRRPLFIADPGELASGGEELLKLLPALGGTVANPSAREKILKRKGAFWSGQFPRLDAILYTIQQSFGCVSDLTEARLVKRYGTIFENLLHAALRAAGLRTEKLQYLIPEAFYWTADTAGRREQRTRQRPLQLDLVIARAGREVQTRQDLIWPEELFCSIKTSSKERIAQVFHDGAAIQRQTVWRIHRYYLLLHNDVQRTKGPGVGPTFVFGGFMSGARTFPLDGIFFLDVPPNVSSRVLRAPGAEEEGEDAVEGNGGEYADAEVTRKIGKMSEFLCREVWMAVP